MSRPAENTRVGLPRAMNTTSSPSSTASELISCAAMAIRSSTGCSTVTTWLDCRYEAASVSTRGVSANSLPSDVTKPPCSSVNRMRRAVARGRSAARARSLSVAGPPMVPNTSEQADAAVEALDEIGGALVALAAFQLWHWPFRLEAFKIVLAVLPRHVIIRPLVQ